MCCDRVVEGKECKVLLKAITARLIRLALCKIPKYLKTNYGKYTIESICCVSDSRICKDLHDLLYLIIPLTDDKSFDMYSYLYKYITVIKIAEVCSYLGLDVKKLYSAYAFTYLTLMRLHSGYHIIERSYEDNNITYNDVYKMLNDYLQMN